MSGKFIFAVDDDPGRYEHFGRLLEARGWRLVVGCCPACVSRWADKASAIMLDHDLDGAETCACGAEIVWDNSRMYLDEVAAAAVPVIISSASSRSNVRFLSEWLLAAGCCYTTISAVDADPELKWLGWLWTKGVLCLHPKKVGDL